MHTQRHPLTSESLPGEIDCAEVNVSEKKKNDTNDNNMVNSSLEKKEKGGCNLNAAAYL